MKVLTVLANISFKANVRRAKLDGVPHLVVPVVAIKQGILNGIFYPNEELENFAQTWNGVPVPVGHPKNADGVNITANCAEAIDTVNIGIFLNVEFKNDCIQGEIWINIAKAKRLGFEDVLTRLEEGEVMEVSTGLHALSLPVTGEFNGVTYERQIHSIRPDHLALLPNEIGACSVAAGCGTMRQNAELQTNCGDKHTCSCGNKAKPILEANSLLTSLRKHYFSGVSFFDNEESHDKIRQALQRALRDTLTGNEWAWVAEVFDSYYVFEHDGKLYKQSYTLDDSGNAILVGERKEVKSVVSYVPVSEPINNTMKPERKTALVMALATAALVGNAAAVTDETRKPFESMSDDMLNNMAKAHGINLDDDGKAVVVNVVQPPPLPRQDTPVVTNGGLSQEQALTLSRLQAREEAQLAAKRTAVMAINAAYTQAVVNGMDEPTLDATLAVNGQVPSNSPTVYGIAGNTPHVNNTQPVKPERATFKGLVNVAKEVIPTAQ